MRLYYGGYGHHPSGKQYVYWGDDNYRTGQNVNVPVTHWKSGKNYNTMFTIMRTSGSEMGEREAQRLERLGINIKFINGTNVMTLPGAYDFSSKKEWKEYSNEQYDREMRLRLGQFKKPEISLQAQERLTTNFRVAVNKAYTPEAVKNYRPQRNVVKNEMPKVSVNKEFKPNKTDFTKKMY